MLQENLLHGRFLAELTKEVFNDLEETKYQHTEYRISIYGRKPVEWDILAAWVCQNKLYSDNNVWLIQVRLRRHRYPHCAQVVVWKAYACTPRDGWPAQRCGRCVAASSTDA